MNLFYYDIAFFAFGFIALTNLKLSFALVYLPRLLRPETLVYIIKDGTRIRYRLVRIKMHKLKKEIKYWVNTSVTDSKSFYPNGYLFVFFISYFDRV